MTRTTTTSTTTSLPYVFHGISMARSMRRGQIEAGRWDETLKRETSDDRGDIGFIYVYIILVYHVLS